MTRFMRIFLLVPLLIIVHPAPSYCEDDKHLSAVMLLLKSKPLKADTVAKATTQFGSQLNAAVAVLLSADQGFSWSQIIDAIEAGTLKADGSITGVSPQVSLLQQKATMGDLVLPNASAEEMKNILAKWMNSDERNKFVFFTLIEAICFGYSFDQIFPAFEMGVILSSGLILCFDNDLSKCVRDESDGMIYLRPDARVGDELDLRWNDCEGSERLTHPIQGCWEKSNYLAIIEEKTGGFIYIGISPSFKHSGTIKLIDTDTYGGKLKDDPDFCCGNNGYLWLKIKDKDTVSVKSEWYNPPLNFDWEDLTKSTCD